MTHPITKLVSLVALIAATSVVSNANADEYRHIDRLAVKIRNSARKIKRETVHYRHTPQYRHLVADSNDLYRLATHIHDVTHFEGNLTHLLIDLDKLDQTFHHLEGVFDQVEHDAAFGDGHVHGSTSHVKRLLNSIENDIHHIHEDVATIRNRPIIVNPPVYDRFNHPTGRVPYCDQGHGTHGSSRYGNSGYRGNGFGFSIGGGRSRIQFHF